MLLLYDEKYVTMPSLYASPKQLQKLEMNANMETQSTYFHGAATRENLKNHVCGQSSRKELLSELIKIFYSDKGSNFASIFFLTTTAKLFCSKPDQIPSTQFSLSSSRPRCMLAENQSLVSICNLYKTFRLEMLTLIFFLWNFQS